jgi:hypothetical protein
MPEQVHHGPLHLQRYLTTCSDELAKALQASVEHPITIVSSLQCACRQSIILHRKQPPPPPAPQTLAQDVEERTAAVRRRNVESGRGETLPGLDQNGPGERRVACRFFSLKINDEEAVLHAFCRRCDKRILVFDRALYWGLKRDTTVTPQTFPYRCSCGSHTFEVALGLVYPEEAMDENDLEMITVAVRCASCAEVALILEDEAT